MKVTSLNTKTITGADAATLDAAVQTFVKTLTNEVLVRVEFGVISGELVCFIAYST